MTFLKKINFYKITTNKLIFIIFVFIYSILFYRTFRHIFLSELFMDELSTIYKGIILNPIDLFGFMIKDSHPPLYYFVIKIFSFTLPKTFYGIRIISWLFYILSGILIAIFTFLLSRGFSFLKEISAGGIAGLIFLSNPLTVENSSYGKMYTFLCLMISLTLIVRYFTLEKRELIIKNSNHYFYTISLSLLSLVHYYGSIYSFSLIIIDFLFERDNRLLKKQIYSLIPIQIWIIFFNLIGFIKNSASKASFKEFDFISLLKGYFLGEKPILAILFVLLIFLISVYKGKFDENTTLIKGLNWTGIYSSFLTLLIALILSSKLSILSPRFFIFAVPSISISIALMSINILNRRYFNFYIFGLILFIVFQFWNYSFIALNEYSDSGLRLNSILNSARTFKEISLETYKYKSRFSIFPNKVLNANEFLMKEDKLIPYNTNRFEKINKMNKFIREKNMDDPFIVAFTKKESLINRFNKVNEKLLKKGYKCLSLKETSEFQIFECKFKS